MQKSANVGFVVMVVVGPHDGHLLAPFGFILQALHVQYLKNITPDLVDGVEWEELQNMIGFWIQHLQVTVQVLYAHERRLAFVVFKDLGQSVWAECVGKLAHAGMTAFLQFGEAVARSRRSPEKLCGLLDMFDAMEKSAKSILRVFDGETVGIRSRFKDLQKQVGNCYLNCILAIGG
jgi:exocyst complex protein 7